MSPTETCVLRPGENCWRREHAGRVAVIVDAARYFEVVASAIEGAERSVVILGWDVHSRVRLRREGSDHGDDHELRKLLDDAARRGVRVHVLMWDYSLLFALEREPLPTLQLGWLTHPNLEVALAADHPTGGCHHQKIVVIDDALAFSGGIDLTIARWDEREHRPEHPERVTPGGEAYGPFHDVQLAVDGDAARALGELARRRWRQATSRDLPKAATDGDADRWPDDLEVTMTDVEVGIARTEAAFHDRQPKHEVEQLYLDAIATADHLIYLENQYLTAPKIADALADRLRDPEGPEVVIITPRDQSGRLEEMTMGALRRRWASQLRRADAHGRLSIRTPLADGERPVNVHAKVMIVDDQLLRIGSANLSRRSMRIDSECDLIVEANGDRARRRAIRDVRLSLLAEHLDLPVEDVERALDDVAVVPAIAALDEGRDRLVELVPPEPTDESLGALIADPAEPLDEAIANHLLPRDRRPNASAAWPRLLAVVVFCFAMAGLWTWTPLERWVHPEALRELVAPMVEHPAGVVVYGALAALASLAAVPITALIVAASLLFGPWLGSVAAALASMLSAAAGYAAGRGILRDTVQRLVGERFERVRHALERRGTLAVIALRVVPVAPFSVVNVVAGSSHLSFSDYMLGTALGMLPGIVGLSFAADRIAAAVRSPDETTILLALGVAAVVGFGLFGLRRWLSDAARAPGEST